MVTSSNVTWGRQFFQSDILKNEFDRMEKRIPIDLLNMKRYELPPPPPGKQTDASAWLECVENSCAQLEHQASRWAGLQDIFALLQLFHHSGGSFPFSLFFAQNRIINLEIMADYGSNSWRVYNNTLKSMQSEAEKQLDKIKQRMQQINLSRKNEQTMAGSKIRALEQRYSLSLLFLQTHFTWLPLVSWIDLVKITFYLQICLLLLLLVV